MKANKNNTNVIYMYTLFGLHAYLGKGKTTARAYNLKAHKHCIPAELFENGLYKNIKVHIIANNLTNKQATLIEAKMIRRQGLEGVWNNINGLTPEKARKIAYEILDRPISINAFMTVPSELVKNIINEIKVKGNILIPADKNAEIHQQIKNLGNTTIIIDDDPGSRTLHSEIKNTSRLIIENGNFLEKDFGDKKYDLIIMNPPWTVLTIKFIEKSINLLNKNGKLVCIGSYRNFTKKPTKKGPVPGSFLDLHKKGHFERIETFHSQAKYFKGTNDWFWFIWQNKTSNKPTIIKNKAGDQFKYILSNEYFVPQLPNENDYFDYSKKTESYTLKPKFIFKEDSTTFLYNSESLEKSIQEFKKGELNNKGREIFRNISKEEFLNLQIFKDYDWKYIVKLYKYPRFGGLRIPAIRKNNE